MRYSQHDDRGEPEEQPLKSSYDGTGSHYDRKNDRLQGRNRIGDRLTYPSNRDIDKSSRGNRSSRDAPPEAPRSNKYSIDRVERDDNDELAGKISGNGVDGGRSWNRSEGAGRGDRSYGWGRSGGGFRGGRGGPHGGFAGERRGRRDGHDDRDEYDYNDKNDGRARTAGDDNGRDEHGFVPGGGRLSRSMEARLGSVETRGTAGSAREREGFGGGGGYGGGGSGRYRGEHDDRDADDGGYGRYGGHGGRGYGRGIGRGRNWSEHDDRVDDGGDGGYGGYGGRGRDRYRGEHDDRDAAKDADGGGYGGRGRGRGWDGRPQGDMAGHNLARDGGGFGGGRGWGRGTGRRSYAEGDARGRDRERSRSPMGRWGHDKFQELLQEDAAGEPEAGGGQQPRGRQRGQRWGPGARPGEDRNGGGAAEEGDEAGAGDWGPDRGSGPTGKLDDELMAEAAEAAAYDELAD